MDLLEQAMQDEDINFIQHLLRAYPKLKHHVFDDECKGETKTVVRHKKFNINQSFF